MVQLDEKLDAQRHQRQRHAEIDRRENPAAREQQFFDRLFHPDQTPARLWVVPRFYLSRGAMVLTNVLDVGRCGRRVGQPSPLARAKRGSMSAGPARRGQRHCPRHFEAARMQLAKLHANPESRLRDLVAGTGGNHRAHAECRTCRRVDTGRRGARPALSLLTAIFQSPGVSRRRTALSGFSQLFSKPCSNSAPSPPTTRLGSPITGELRQAYLEPLGISSLLDAPIYVGGKVAGVVCHEHVGAPRAWTEAECSFVATVADTIARVYGEYEYRHAETALESYQQHLMELHRMEALGRMAAGVAHDFRGIVALRWASPN